MDKMIEETTQKCLEKKDIETLKKIGISAENSNNFLKLLAEIIVEIIIKETSDERNRLRKDQ